MPTIPAILALLVKQPANKFHIHEKVLCVSLGIRDQDALSRRGQLTEAIKLTNSGCLKDSVQYETYGQREEFSTAMLSGVSHISHVPRYFRFGTPIFTSLLLLSK